MKKALLLVIVLFLLSPAFAQEIYRPTWVRQAVYFTVTPALRDMPQLKPAKKKGTIVAVPNKTNRKADIGRESYPFLLDEDPVWQKIQWPEVTLNAGPIQNFEGISNLSGVYPPDTQGDVGGNHYVQVVNSNFAVYSKTGTLLLGPAALHTIWSGIPAPWNGTDDGDPIVLYDQAADRWMISQFSLPTGNYAELIAISQTNDPTGPWYQYVFQFGTKMPDYPKFGVWPDGYYMSINQFANGSTWAGVGACAFDRTKMLAGDPTAGMVYFDLGVSGAPWSMLPSDWDGTTTPLPNEPNYWTYNDDWSSPSQDLLQIWQFHVDWTVPANSTFASSLSLPVAPYKSNICTATRDRCIPQPGTTVKLESLADRLMQRLQYRNFGTHQSMVTNHTVDVDNTGHAGIRWYELRKSGGAWFVYQQGTYAPDAKHRWMASVAMNGQGDIALGYSVSDAYSEYPGIRYTGRKNSDPLNQMTIPEQTVITGSGSQTGSAARWGDYSMMSVDPADDKTFWYTQQYVQVTGPVNWRTRIASFQFLDAPVVQTLAVSGVTNTAVTLNGTINPNGLPSTWYFQWGATTAYGNTTPVSPAGSGTAVIQVNVPITGLTAGNNYHYRIVGVNTDGTQYGLDRSFFAGGAVVLTSPVSGITHNAAVCGGIVAEEGGSPVTARGVCWSTGPNPTIADNHTTDGTGAGTFTSTITGLLGNTVYYVRAYATNGLVTTYGPEEQFQTTCGFYSLPYAQSFPTTSIPSCWSQVDHQGNGQVWQFGVITGQSPNPDLTGNYAFLNSDAYGYGASQNADLISPGFDLTGFINVTLEFKHYFRAFGGSYGVVAYSIDNGNTWTQLEMFLTTTTNPALWSQVIPGVAGQSQVRFKWNYTGSWGYYWAIDDISITGQPAVLAVSPSNRNVGPAGSSATYTVYSVTGTWNATSNQTWCSISPPVPFSQYLTVNYSSNPTANTRTATITVSEYGMPSVNVTLTQSGLIPPTGLTGILVGNNANLSWNKPAFSSGPSPGNAPSLPVACDQCESEIAAVTHPPNIPVIPLPSGGTKSLMNVLLWNNGPIVNSPGTGAGGTDESILFTPLTIFGFGAQQLNGNTLADDFTVPSGAGWNPENFVFYTYQTGSSLSSPITGLFFRIYNGDPSAGGIVIWGDLTTNRLTSTSFDNVYRTTAINGGTDRPVMRVEGSVSGLHLAPGTYWVEFQMAGNTSLTGPWMPPITITGTNTTGNAKQWTPSTGWQNAISGTSYQQGIPFLIEEFIPGLVGYNVYRNGNLIDFVSPYTTTTFSDNNLQVGTYSYLVTAKYDLTLYGLPGQFGESNAAGPVQLINNQNPVNLEITNVTVDNAQTLCNYASQNITVAGNGTTFWVMPGGSATLVAGSKISFLPGTKVHLQGYLHGYIDASGNPCAQANPVYPTVLAVEENTSNTAGNKVFRVYPNPSTGRFTLEMKDGFSADRLHLTVFNMMGARIMKQEMVNQRKIEIRAEQWPKGVYLIHISGEDINATSTVVRQ